MDTRQGDGGSLGAIPGDQARLLNKEKRAKSTWGVRGPRASDTQLKNKVALGKGVEMMRDTYSKGKSSRSLVT